MIKILESDIDLVTVGISYTCGSDSRVFDYTSDNYVSDTSISRAAVSAEEECEWQFSEKVNNICQGIYPESELDNSISGEYHFILPRKLFSELYDALIGYSYDYEFDVPNYSDEYYDVDNNASCYVQDVYIIE